MPKNSWKDLIETISTTEAVDIICPSCGVPMSLRNPGSFEMNLTVNATQEFNKVLRSYSSYLSSVESELDTRNTPSLTQNFDAEYPYIDLEALPKESQDDGLWKTGGADDIRRNWWEPFDRYRFAENLQEKLPRITELEARLADADGQPASQQTRPQSAAKPFDVALQLLIGGFEPRRIIGRIMNLVFEQPHVRAWRAHVLADRHVYPADGAEDSSQELDAVLTPTFARYFKLFDKVLGDEKIAAALLSEKNRKAAAAHRDALLRIRLIIVLLLGHQNPEVAKKYPDLLGDRIPFTLPLRVIVPPKLVSQLLTSAAVTDLTGLSLSAEYLAAVRQDSRISPDSEGDGEAAIQDFVGRFSRDVHRILIFTCRGPSGSDPRSVSPGSESPASFGPLDTDRCGWYPKEDETHPIVFIGSPGSGKSTVMLTGLIQFCLNAQALGVVTKFESQRDVRKYTKYLEDYWQGILPNATPAATKSSIQFRVETNGKEIVGRNFVFTDIPGEVLSRGTRSDGADPVILSVLKHADTIVFLFDLTIEPSIRYQLAGVQLNGASGETGPWSDLIGNVKDTIATRPPEEAATAGGNNTSQTGESKAKVDQFQLLERIISDLREMRGNDLKSGPNFVCIVPKADLFAVRSTTERTPGIEKIKFLTGFFEELRKMGAIAPSPNVSLPEGGSGREQPTVEFFQSKIGYASQNDSKAGDPQPVVRHLRLARRISDLAQEHLAGIGDALGSDANDAFRQSLGETISVRLIGRIKSVFAAEGVFVIPVSAQGTNEPLDNRRIGPEAATGGQSVEPKEKRLEHPPNAKLAEYAFMLPVLLALSKDGSFGGSGSDDAPPWQASV